MKSIFTLLAYKCAEVFEPVEGLIVGIVEIVRAVVSGTGEVKNVIAVDNKAYVLESDLSRVFFTAVDKMSDKSPMLEVVRAYK